MCKGVSGYEHDYGSVVSTQSSALPYNIVGRIDKETASRRFFLSRHGGG